MTRVGFIVAARAALKIGAAAAALGWGAASAQEASPEIAEFLTIPAAEADLEALTWVKRPVVVFADTAADPRFTEQIRLLNDRADALAERDVVVIIDTDPAGKSALRTKLRPRGFMLVLIGKDGGVKLRKPAPWDVRELSRVIDKMPMRQDEIRRAREGS